MVKKKSLVWQNCSEGNLVARIKEWLTETNLTSSVIFLEGEMGSGKSTFVRDILHVLSPDTITQGSPTFPLVQLYPLKNGNQFYHIDLYRLKSEDELADSGIESQMEEPISIACVEWASLFPDAFAHWFNPSLPKRKNVFVIHITSGEPDTRSYEIQEY